MASAERKGAPAKFDWRSSEGVEALGKEIYSEFKQDRITTLAAAFAYHTVFAIPALIILSVAVAAFLDNVANVHVAQWLRTLISDHAPGNTKDLLNSIVDDAVAKVGGGGATFGVLATVVVALWSGSNAIGSLIEAFNRAFDVEEGRSFLKRRLLALGLTLLLAIFVNLAFVLLVFGGRIGSWIADGVGLGGAFDTLWNLLRWPAAIVAVGLVLAILYYAGPNIEQSFRWVSPGSVLATILWLVATAGFGLYLNVSNPGSAYGAVGSVLVLLFFLYVTGIIFLLGAELNAVLGKRYDPETVQDLATNPKAKPEARERAQRTRRETSAT
jgi:membrane protein